MSRSLQILLAVGLVAGGIAAYWFLALGPKRDEVTQLETQVATKQAEVQQAETTARNYEATRRAYRDNYATVVRLGKAVPAGDDVRSLVVQLDASAKRARIDFSDISLTGVGSDQGSAGSASATGRFTTLPFTFAFRGSFFRVSDFLSQLDRFVHVDGDSIDVTGRLLHIDGFTLNPEGDGSSALKAEVGVTSYELPASTGVTAGATAQAPATAGTATPTPSTGGESTTTTATAGVTG